MSGLSLVELLAIFAAAAGAVWVAGIQLSDATDVLSRRLGFGEALGGVILLAVATNLPEIAIVVSAALSGSYELAIGNILGGIAIQTVVLVVLDVVGVRGRHPLTYRAASLTLVIEGALVIGVLVVAIMASRLPSHDVFVHLSPGSSLILVLWIGGVYLVGRSSNLPWQSRGVAPDGQPEPKGHAEDKKEKAASSKGHSTSRVAAVFAVAALITLAAGVVLEQSGDAIATNVGLSGVLFGATVLAAATALPEVSSGLASVKLGDYQLAVSDIFGGNAFLPVLFFVATAISGTSVLPKAQDADIYMAGLGILLTTVYIFGLIFRPQRRILRMGPDSLTALILYALGIIGLVVVAGQ
ncbi:MAG: cation:H+ antiporter [Solirubrobacteraceae bacterium]|nr:cation:H+ antiporter [Solirubrobacteraceae bacterium]